MNKYSMNDTTINWIHQNTVDRVKEIPINEIAEKLGLELKKSGSRFVALCPLHNEKTASFFLTVGKGFKCFGCGQSGDNIELFKKITGTDNFQESVKGVAEMFNIPIEYENQQQQKATPTIKPKLTIATFSSVPVNVEVKTNRINDDITEVKTIYLYSESQHIERIERYDANNNRIEFTLPNRDKPDHKQILPYHIDCNGNIINKKGEKPWDFYRQNEAAQFGKNKWVLMPEGESCVEALRSLGIVGLSRMGSDKGEESVKRNFTALKNAFVSGVVLIADNDDIGLSECEKFSRWASEVGLNTVVIPTKAFWIEAPKKGDIVDFIKSHPEINQAEFLKLLEGAIRDTDNLLRSSKPEQQSNVVPFQRQETATLPPIKEALKALMERNLSSADLENEFLELSGIYPRYSKNAIEGLYRKLSDDSEKQSDKNNQKNNLDKLLRLSKNSLDLSDYLHPNLATPLKNIAQWMGTSQEAILTTLLPTVASLIHLDTQLELIKATNFYANPIIYSGIVAESGSLKSPTQKLITNPLHKLQEIADQDYESLMQDYLEDLDFYKDSKKDKNNPPPTPPTPPKRREYFVADVTSEAVATVQSDQPTRGFLGIQDELKALINSQNAYRGGKGSDAEKLLSGRDGTGIKVNRAGGKRLFCARSGYSITGGIQPDVLRQLMGNFDDPNGFWARFIWCILPITPSRYPENTVSFDVDNLLLDIYRKIENEKPQTHKLSTEARELYKDWYNQLDDLKLKEIRQGLRAVYSKMKGVTGEFALILHRLNNAVGGIQPDEFISKDTMAKAIKLAKFYISQVKLIHAEGEAEQGVLAPRLKKLYDFALSQTAWLSASAIKSGCRLFKKSKIEDIRQACLDLVEMGYGEVEGKGKALKYCADIQKLTNIDTVSTFTKKPESIESIKLQEINQNIEVDKVDKKLTQCQPSQTLDSIGLQPLDDPKVDKLTHNTTDKTKSPNQLDEKTEINTDLLTDRQLCQQTNSNPDIITVDGVSTSVNFASTLSTSSERPTEPLPSDYRPTQQELTSAPPLPSFIDLAVRIDFDSLKQGETIFDNNGTPHTLSQNSWGYYWLTTDGLRIDKDNIGNFHRE